MPVYKCPICSTSLSLADIPQIGEMVTCLHCELTLEVVWLFPLELLPATAQPGVNLGLLTD